MLPHHHTAENNENVVDQRSKGGKQKQAVGKQHGRDNSANIKENLCRQQDASEMDAQL